MLHVDTGEAVRLAGVIDGVGDASAGASASLAPTPVRDASAFACRQKGPVVRFGAGSVASKPGAAAAATRPIRIGW